MPLFIPKIFKTTSFICTLSHKSSALLTECSIFIKSGYFKNALFLMKSNQIVFIALFLPIFFPLWHIVYLVSIIAILPCCHLTYSSLFALILKCTQVNFLKMSSLPAGLFPADFLWPNVTPKHLHL